MQKTGQYEKAFEYLFKELGYDTKQKWVTWADEKIRGRSGGAGPGYIIDPVITDERPGFDPTGGLNDIGATGYKPDGTGRAGSALIERVLPEIQAATAPGSIHVKGGRATQFTQNDVDQLKRYFNNAPADNVVGALSALDSQVNFDGVGAVEVAKSNLVRTIVQRNIRELQRGVAPRNFGSRQVSGEGGGTTINPGGTGHNPAGGGDPSENPGPGGIGKAKGGLVKRIRELHSW